MIKSLSQLSYEGQRKQLEGIFKEAVQTSTYEDFIAVLESHKVYTNVRRAIDGSTHRSFVFYGKEYHVQEMRGILEQETSFLYSLRMSVKLEEDAAKKKEYSKRMSELRQEESQAKTSQMAQEQKSQKKATEKQAKISDRNKQLEQLHKAKKTIASDVYNELKSDQREENEIKKAQERARDLY